MVEVSALRGLSAPVPLGADIIREDVNICGPIPEQQKGSDGTNCLGKYRFAVLRVEFDRPIQVVSHSQEFGSQGRRGNNPAVADWFGLVQLRCHRPGRVRIFPSDPASMLSSTPSYDSWNFPSFLVPAGLGLPRNLSLPNAMTPTGTENNTRARDVEHSPAMLLASLMSAVSAKHRTKRVFAAALLLSSEELVPPEAMRASGRIVGGTWAENAFVSASWLQNCSAEFLPPSVQTWDPQRSFVGFPSNSSGGKRDLLGRLSVPCKMINETDYRGLEDEEVYHPIEVQNAAASAAGKLFAKRLATVKMLAKLFRGERAQPVTCKSSISSSQESGMQQEMAQVFPKKLEVQEAGTDSGFKAARALKNRTASTNFLEEEQEAEMLISQLNLEATGTTGVASHVMKALKLTQALKKFSMSVNQAVRSNLATDVQQSDLAASWVVIMDKLGTELPMVLVPHLADNIGPAIMSQVPKATEDHIVYGISDAISNSLSLDVINNLADSTYEAVAKGVPKLVNDIIPLHFALDIQRRAASILAKSLSHATVPALVHSLTHSPLQDYYCYFCFHQKLYCQYCNYSPQQLYYSLYYTGYYSNYYSDYFTTWMYESIRREGKGGSARSSNVRDENLPWTSAGPFPVVGEALKTKFVTPFLK